MCSNSCVYLSWVSSLELSLELSSKLTLGVASPIGSISNRYNGTFNNLFSLYTWKGLTSSGVKSIDAKCSTCEYVPSYRKRSSKASSSWVNFFTFTMLVKSLTISFGSYFLPENVANFRDLIIYGYFHACTKSGSLIAPHCNRNVGQMAFFYIFSHALNPPSPAIWSAISLAISLFRK